MIYQGEELITIGQIFNKALEIAEHHPANAENFLMEYARYIQSKSDRYMTIYEAIGIAKSNFAYFSGYYSNSVSTLIHKVYCKVI